jgi:hypothetical protein
MPKASVDKDCHMFTREYKIRSAREISSMEPESTAHSVSSPSHPKFWGCVLSADSGHQP